MISFGSPLKFALVAIFLVVLLEYGSTAEKVAPCCKTVSTEEITEKITGYTIQKAEPPCVQAVIFHTEKGLFCTYLRAAWVLPKIQDFRKRARAESTKAAPTPVSLLSLITSTTAPSTAGTRHTPPPSPPEDHHRYGLNTKHRTRST
uniref:Chemokine interleukin-8-like domain-containing protein n=1 Tax=Echeneis naucrates TaxID=173247 RepID=A0A665WR89_ECHNA